MPALAERAQTDVSLDYYSEPNFAELVGEVNLEAPTERQYILRCPIKVPDYAVVIPTEMEWCEEFVQRSLEYQRDVVRLAHPFAYLTIRHGLVESVTDDLLHVDGFSMKIPHRPEQNYVWASNSPTVIEAFGMEIPEDFDPLKHNLQYLIQDSRPENPVIQETRPKHVYAMDPYVFHRRPTLNPETVRTFLRLSLTAIPIDDRNNFVNPAFGNITSDYDGVVDFRDNLNRYALR